MKIGKHLSIISIIIATYFIIDKILFDIKTYNIIKSEFVSGDAQPTLVSGGTKIIIIYIVPMLISLVLSIIGAKRKNRFRKTGLTLNILTIIYLIIPLGLILSIL